MERVAQRALLRLARETVDDAARVGPGGTFGTPPSLAELSADPVLIRNAGAFVSLHDHAGSVRGCVGTTLAVRPLLEVVPDMARAATLRDPRFTPVRPEEVPTLEIEISILEPPEPIATLDEIIIGRDGLLVMGLGCRGVLLPQVADERGWDAITFAEHTCRKAGLPAKAYRQDGVELYRFCAEVFSERETTADRAVLSL